MSVLEEIEKLRQEHMNAEGQESREEQILNEEPKTCQISEQPVESNVPMVATDTVQEGLNKAIQRTIEDGGGIKELARDLTYLSGASKLQGNDEFTEAYGNVLGESLIKDLQDEGKRQAIVAAAREQEARNIRAEAYYKGWKPIFDLLGIEQAFGLAGMKTVVIVMILPFLLVSLCRFVVNSINSLFTAISQFTKPAMLICSFMLGLLLFAIVGLAACWGVDSIFGTTILSNLAA